MCTCWRCRLQRSCRCQSSKSCCGAAVRAGAALTSIIGRLAPILGILGPILGTWHARCNSTGMQCHTVCWWNGGLFGIRCRGLLCTRSRSAVPQRWQARENLWKKPTCHYSLGGVGLGGVGVGMDGPPGGFRAGAEVGVSCPAGLGPRLEVRRWTPATSDGFALHNPEYIPAQQSQSLATLLTYPPSHTIWHK